MDERVASVTKKTSAKAEGSEKKLLRRDSPFSYVCRQCNRCCSKKIIKLNPYEVARLSANRGISTTNLIRTFTLAHGTVLKLTDSGECIFHTPQGCVVHPDRPLVCRLYPLGRHVGANGEESFSLLPPHPESAGVFGHDGTIADYLELQGAGPYIDSVGKYLSLLSHMLSALRADGAVEAKETLPVQNRSPERTDAGVRIGLEWLDMDLLVSDFCAHRGLSVPTRPEEKMTIHIRAIETKFDHLSQGG
jgi:Fe-S-cluster containining protein